MLFDLGAAAVAVKVVITGVFLVYSSIIVPVQVRLEWPGLSTACCSPQGRGGADRGDPVGSGFGGLIADGRWIPGLGGFFEALHSSMTQISLLAPWPLGLR